MLNIRKVRKIVKAQSGVQLNPSGSLFKNTSITFDKHIQGIEDTSLLRAKQKIAADARKAANLNKASNIASIVGGAADVLGGALFSGQRANDSGLTTGINTAWDTAANAAMMFAPVGTIVGGAMKAGAFIQDGLQAMGGGTDQMTVTDQILDSPLGLIAGVGLINGFGGKKSQNFEVDQETISQVGSSYGGSVSDINAAKEVAGKKYGAFSSSARKRANRQIDEARRQQNIMTNIAEDQADRSAIASSMSQLNNMNYQFNLNGGIDQRYIRAAKDGMKISNKIDLLKSRNINKQFINVDTKMITPVIYEPEDQCGYYQKGGSVNKKKEVNYVISDNDRSLEELLNLSKIKEYYKNYNLDNINFIYDNQPRTENNNLYVKSDEDAVHELWHYLSKNQPNETYKEYYDNLNDDRIVALGGDLQFVKRFENDPGYFYHPSELEARIKAAKFKTQGQTYTKEFFQNLRKDENKYGDNMRDLLHMYNDDNLERIFNLKNGGILEESTALKIEENDQKNVIPEGALHAHKHHMENSEGLTQKGIPVVDNEGEQQAEIEKNEIIFNLEVTKKLEEFYEKYNNKDLTQKEKDNIAIEAGKLLVNEILYNTDDRTGLIDTIENEPS